MICSTCNGKGSYIVRWKLSESNPEGVNIEEVCHKCDGTGQVGNISEGEVRHLQVCEKMLIEVRSIALGDDESDPLFDKWLGATVGSAEEIPGLVRDRMEEIAELHREAYRLRECLKDALASLNTTLAYDVIPRVQLIRLGILLEDTINNRA